MEYLNWELSVLSRSVAYANLSAAASHVGVSQPQLSRIVARLESEFGVSLLDREAKRKSSWTPAAHRLSEVYSNSLNIFRSGVVDLVEGTRVSHVTIGTLEGLSPIGLTLSHYLFKTAAVRVLELDVLDLNDLEEGFNRRQLDLILTFREPVRRKLKFIRKLGYQTLDESGSRNGVAVMSTFEFGSRAHATKSRSSKEDSPILVSNSLEVRRRWIEDLGGSGILPTEVRSERSGKLSEVPVLMIAAEDTPPVFWEKLKGYKPSSPL